MKERIRKIWHDLYYGLGSAFAVDFALTCRHVVEQVDLTDRPLTWGAWLRVKLHLSLCRACHNYFVAGKALRRALREVTKVSGESADVEKINRELIEKYARAKDSSDGSPPS